ncbi:alpha/beta fold hydrolase [Limihaloglobus sulfuriphilus]|nr:alpha/beta fold hydrolase [Limihaloglobus sulfuriphilus]
MALRKDVLINGNQINELEPYNKAWYVDFQGWVPGEYWFINNEGLNVVGSGDYIPAITTVYTDFSTLWVKVKMRMEHYSEGGIIITDNPIGSQPLFNYLSVCCRPIWTDIFVNYVKNGEQFHEQICEGCIYPWTWFDISIKIADNHLKVKINELEEKEITFKDLSFDENYKLTIFGKKDWLSGISDITFNKLIVYSALESVGCGVSNVFNVNNRDSITVNAVNNWDGTVTVTWTDRGGVRLIRQEVGNTSNETGWSVNGGYFKDTLQPSGFKKKYVYIIRNLSGTELGRSGEVMPDIVVVLIRGYDPNPIGDGISDKYWTSDSGEQNKGLVANVHSWFEESERNITCWDASTMLSGEKNVEWNCEVLDDFISQNRTGDYENAKVNLIGHSMGGLISRRYAYEQDAYIQNVICIQTPHTGSPLADIAGWFAGEAGENLKPSFLKTFNDDYPLDKTTLYSFYSDNYTDVLGKFLYRKANSHITSSPQFTQYDEQSDGAVPLLSGYGWIYKKDTYGDPNYGTYVEQWLPLIAVGPMKDTCNNGFDHSTGYRHPDTLNKIMEWLGYPQADKFYFQKMKIQGLEQSDPENLPLYFINGFTGQFHNAQPVSNTVKIGTSSNAYFRAIVTDPNAVFTLIDPDSEVIDPVTADSDPNIIYDQENGIMAYEIVNPNTGTWTLSLTTLMTELNSVEYGLTVFEDQFVAFSVTGEKDWANSGQAMFLMAEIADNAGAVTGAAVNADIVLPDDTVESITFVDDGTGGDAVSGDGISSYTFTTTEISGKYNVRAYASGTTASSDSFERSAVATFTVSQADIAVSGSISEEGVDTNQNAFYDLLRFTVPVQVSLDGAYRLTASLLDSNSETVSLVNSGTLRLTSESGSITVDVPAEDIVNNGAAGPYILHGIKISDGDSGLTIAAAENYTTAGYLISDFEPKDTDKDGLPDVLELSIGTLIDNPDTDGDGVTDYEEIAYGGDPTRYDPLTDSNPFEAVTDGDGMTDGYEIKYGLNPLIDDTLLDLDGDGLSNIYEYENQLRPDKIDTDDDGRNDKWEIDNGRDPLVYDEYPRNDADIDLNAVINRLDLLILCSQWMDAPGTPSADIAPHGGDGIVNFLDFAVLSGSWLSEVIAPQELSEDFESEDFESGDFSANP